MTSVRRRAILAQQTTKPKGGKQPKIPSLQDQFMTACVQLNETRFKELVGRVRLIGTTYTVNQTDYCGRTPLSHLSGHGSTRCVEEFSRLKLTDVNQADHDGNTPLHYAAQAGHEGVVEALLTKFEGIQVDVRNRQGLTPLIKSCSRGRSRCARLLLQHGADPGARDPRRHLTAAEWAYLCGWPDCGRLIETHLLLCPPAADSDSDSDSDDSDQSETLPAVIRRCESEPAVPEVACSAWLDRHYREVVGSAPGGRRASLPDRSAAYNSARPDTWRCSELPEICIQEVEAAVDPVVVRYGDPVPPPQRETQTDQVNAHKKYLTV